jgi:hypothetical protein
MYRQEKIMESVEGNTLRRLGEGESLDGITTLCLSREHYILGVHVWTSRDYLLDISNKEEEAENGGMG